MMRCDGPAGGGGSAPIGAVEVLVCAGLAALSLVVSAAPGYDAWSWLQWGREVARLELFTDGGPAFKPLPVAITALLAPAGGAAPELWLLLSRAASLLGVVVAARLARRLSGGSVLAGVAGGLGVVLCSGWLAVVAGGGAEAPVILLGLLACERGLSGRPGPALALGFGAALMRPESWPLLGLYAAWAWRREPSLRRWIIAGAAALPACWLGPEILASGDALRSGQRATVPNLGAPALAPRPALASLERAAGLALAPLALAGAAAVALGIARRVVSPRTESPIGPIAVLALGGLAWMVLVAVMSEVGFSGEERYALPGAAALGVAGAAALGWLATAVSGRAAALATAALAAVVLASALGRAGEVSDAWGSVRDAAALTRDLESAVAAAGGAARVRACGRPFVGAYRGPMLAWHLDVPKARVGFLPRAPGVVFRSRLNSAAPISPALGPRAAFGPVARTARWEVVAACAAAKGGERRG